MASAAPVWAPRDLTLRYPVALRQVLSVCQGRSPDRFQYEMAFNARRRPEVAATIDVLSAGRFTLTWPELPNHHCGFVEVGRDLVEI